MIFFSQVRLKLSQVDQKLDALSKMQKEVKATRTELRSLEDDRDVKEHVSKFRILFYSLIVCIYTAKLTI